MGKLILEMQMSLDGYMAGPDGQTDWMLWNWGPEWTWDKDLQEFHTKLTLSAAHLIISRQMAEEGFIAHWQQTANRNDEQALFAKHINATPKTVVSTTLTKDEDIPGGWNGVDITDDPVAAITNLKREQEGNILVYGGARLVSSLLASALIDELYLLINPVVIGKGLTAFQFRQHFKLAAVRSFPTGIILSHYLPLKTQ